MSNTLKFTDKDALKISLCGGKGVSLANMAQGGFSVPQGFIITARAYQKFIAQAENLDLNFNYEKLEILEKEAEKIRNYLKTLDLPNDLKKEIKGNLEILGKDKAFSVPSSSNPAWTPLFYSAKGLITESGEVLSHRV